MFETWACEGVRRGVTGGGERMLEEGWFDLRRLAGCVGGGGRDECVCVCVCRKEREGVCVEGKNGSGSFNCVVSHIEPDVFYCVHLLHIQYTSIQVYKY